MRSAKGVADEVVGQVCMLDPCARAGHVRYRVGRTVYALIDVLDLPTTGREEDAVDQLSMYALALDSEGENVPALDAAAAFGAWAGERQEGGGQAVFWGEHSLDEQRFFNIVCWVFGQDPQRFENLVADGLLPENRAARCPGEWAQIDRSWSRLLDSYLK